MCEERLEVGGWRLGWDVDGVNGGDNGDELWERSITLEWLVQREGTSFPRTYGGGLSG